MRRLIGIPLLIVTLAVSAFLGGYAVGAPLLARATSTSFGLNVMDSGALCNGSHDDTSNFNTAFAAFPSSGGKLLIPRTSAGCKITGTLVEPRNVTIEGEGSGSLIWLSSSAAIPAIQIGDANSSSTLDVHGNGLRNLQVQGNGMSVVGQVGVKVIKGTEVHLENLYVNNVETAYRIDGGGAGTWSASLTGYDLKSSNVKYGVYITASGGSVTDVRLHGGYLWGNSSKIGEGFYSDAMHSSQLAGLSVESFNYCYHVTTSNSSNSAFHGTRAEHCGLGDGTTSYVVDTAQKIAFVTPYDADVVTTAVTKLNGATGAVYPLS